VKVPKSDSPKRPRGRPRLDKPNKRVKTLRLAVDVCDYLDTTDNQATAIEDAIRASKAYKEKKHVSRTKQ
jgi:hypothetical protein